MNFQPTKIIEAAKQFLTACGYFVDNLWHVDDVHFMCEQLELPTIDDAEAMEVFTIANQQFDDEIGISWPKLEEALQSFVHRKHVLKSDYESLPI